MISDEERPSGPDSALKSACGEDTSTSHWMNENIPNFEFLNSVRYWLTIDSWNFDEAVWIVAGVFRTPLGRAADVFKFGAEPRWRRVTREELPEAMKLYGRFLERLWDAAGYDLSPQNPLVWVRYATRSGEALRWIPLGFREPQLRSWIAPFRYLDGKPLLPSTSEKSPPTFIPSSVSASNRTKGKRGPKGKSSENLRAHLRKLGSAEAVLNEGLEALAAQFGFKSTGAVSTIRTQIRKEFENAKLRLENTERCLS